jgi:hypothetical protein
MMSIRRRVFVSYHHAADQWYDDEFSRVFHDRWEALYDNSLERCFDSDDTRYVMQRIRDKHITGIITGSKWLPSQLPSVLLMEIRRAIGEPRIRKPLKALNLGVALQAEIAKAASRIVAAVASDRHQLH